VGSVATGSGARSVLPGVVLAGAVGFLAVAVVTGTSVRSVAVLTVLATIAARVRPAYIAWPKLISALVLVILFIPIRRYALPVNLPFQLEPYRIFVFMLVLVWVGSLLVDPRVRVRRTGFEGPLALIVGASVASIVANPWRVSQLSSEVNKKLMFFLSFLLILYVTTSVIRRLDNIELLTKTLVSGGAVVAAFAIVEARTGFNVFNHLARVVPLLRPQADMALSGADMKRFGAASTRVFASAQHPIALSAALVMLTPLAIYLARRYRQRRWLLCALLLGVAVASTVSRTGITMLIVVVLVFLWLRPTETRRMWPALIPALLCVHFVLPGTLGSLKQAFLPHGGLVAEQKSAAGTSGSGRIADLRPALRQWRVQPLTGMGYGTRVVDASPTQPQANILDDQWLGTLLETGALGAFGWLWLFIRSVRRFGKEAKRDDSDRGWLLASIAAGIAAYAIGMLTYDAFSFIQVTFLLFILIGLGSALMAETPTPLAAKERRALSNSFGGAFGRNGNRGVSG
jgi:O-antigen ligase